ncbi:MAG TPA: class I SAM-dependent methyltransferase [bacterium]|nr:class I SAM-dependent methyltransferase [bacterium]
MKITITELWAKMTEIGLGGWIDVSEGEILKEEIEKLESGQIYTEIGVAYGKSLATMCYYAKEGVNIYGIDRLNWGQRDENIQKLGIEPRHKFIEGDSQQEALAWMESIDLLFIDADHLYDGVKKDLLSWVPHVKSGGVIMMHDYDSPTSPGVVQAVSNFIYPHNAYKDFKFPDRPNSIFRFTKK